MNGLQEVKQSLVVLSEEREKEIMETFQPLAEKIRGYEARLETAKCESEQDAENLNAVRKAIRDDLQIVKDALPEIEQAHKAHKALIAFQKPFAKRLDDVERNYRRIIIAWQEEQARKAEQERRRLQAEEDARAEKERQALLKKAEAVKTEAKKEEYKAKAEAVQTVSVNLETKKTIKTRKEWRVMGVDKKAFLAAACRNPEIYSGYIEINESNLRRAKVANPELELCGVRFEQVTI